MAEHDKERLPQRMQDVLKTIGENAVLFHLFVILTDFPDWSVYQNLEHKGCDIVLINHNLANSHKIKIEVKTRQRLYSTAKINRPPHFTLSEHEYECDFLIGYWFEKNDFYIVPTEYLSPGSNNGKKIYKYIPRKNEDEYLNKWNLIKEVMKEVGV
jgi:hypothetical protein